MRACVIKPVATSAPRLSRRRINEGGWESPGRNARGRDSGKETGMVVRACVCVCVVQGWQGRLRDHEGWFRRRRWVNANPREDTRWALRELTRESRVTANETHRKWEGGREESWADVETVGREKNMDAYLADLSWFLPFSSWNNLWRFPESIRLLHSDRETIRRRKNNE